MRILRWIVVRLLAAGLWLSLTLIATSAILLATIFNPSFIKTTLDKSGLYDTIVSSGLKLASTSLNGDDGTDISGIITGLTPSAKQVLTPALLQANVEKVIDGFGNWLKGQTPMPQFTIDTGEIKTNLNSALATYFSQRVAALPDCPVNNDVPSYDLLTTECRPPVQLSQSDFVKASNDFTSEIPVLDKAQFSSTEIITNTSDSAWVNIPKAYRIASLAPYIFGGLAVIAGALIFLVSRNRAKALRRIGHIFLANGVILLIVGSIASFYFGRNEMAFIANGSTVEQADFMRETLIPLIHHLAISFGSWFLYFGVGYALFGAGCYFVAHLLRLRQRRALETPTETLSSQPSSSPFNQARVSSDDSSGIVPTATEPLPITDSSQTNEPLTKSPPRDKPTLIQ